MNQPVTKSVIKTHQGQMLMLAASQYQTLEQTIREMVQNAIDSNARHVWLKIDRQKRSIVVFDNGEGASVEKFNQALGQVGQTMKMADKLGQFGLGLVAPIDKCAKMTFTSCPKDGEGGYVEWTFEADKIKSQRDEIMIPSRPLPNVIFGRESKARTINGVTVSQVDWRTKVTMTGYTEDRVIARIGSINDLVSQIFSGFGVTMHRKNILLSVELVNENGSAEVRRNLQAPAYAGEKLSQYTTSINGARTFFNLYLAKADTKGKAKGVVLLGIQGNDFRFPFKELVSRVREYLAPDVITALTSGVFEGEILGTLVKLHENRKQFVVNDALVHFSESLNEWYREVGAVHLARVEDLRKDERYQQLGIESLRNLETMLKNPRFAHLATLLKEFQAGSVGRQHSKAKGEVPLGPQGHTAVSTQGSGEATDKLPKARWPTSLDGGSPPKEPKPRDGHHPHTVAGPRGQDRTLVTGGSFGLQFVHSMMQGDSRLWVFEESAGILRFNVRHPTWTMCESSDKRLMQLQELIAVQAIQWFFCPDTVKETMLAHVNDTIDTQVFLLLHSASFNSGAPKKVAE